MDKVIVNQEELVALNQIQNELNEVTITLGLLEIQVNEIQAMKQEAFMRLATIRDKQERLGKELSSKYGNGSVDLNSGEFNKTQ